MFATIDNAVRNALAAGRQLYVTDLEAGRVPEWHRAVVKTKKHGFGTHWEQRPDPGRWAAKFSFDEPRAAALRDAAAALEGAFLASTSAVVREQGGETIVRCLLGASETTELLTECPPTDDNLVGFVRDLIEQGTITTQSVWALRGVVASGSFRIGDAFLVAPSDGQRSLVAPTIPGPGVTDFSTADMLLATRRTVPGADLCNAWQDDLGPRAISALRLACRVDMVALGPTMEGAVFGLGYFAKMPGGRTVQVRRNEPHPPGKEELTAEHIADAAEILPVLDDEPSLALALSRLTQASMRSSAADRMLDLMIVVEALLTTKDENGEINYRLALRGARLLAELADRAAVRKTIKRCYNARSKVVH